MEEPQPLDGDMFGIKTISLFARQLQTIVDVCVQASKSKDARDKLFLSHVKTFNPDAPKPYQNRVSEMEAAMTSLSTAASKLFANLSDLGSCSGGQQLALGNKFSVPFVADKTRETALLKRNAHLGMDVNGAAEGVQGEGAELDSATQMLAVARAAIVEIKDALP